MTLAPGMAWMKVQLVLHSNLPTQQPTYTANPLPEGGKLAQFYS